MAWVLMLLACGTGNLDATDKGGGPGAQGGPGATGPSTSVPVAVSLGDMAPAFDPIDGTALQIPVGGPAGEALQIEISADGASVASLTATPDESGVASITWDGMASSGSLASAGAHTVAVTAEGAEGVSAVVHVVRAGFTQAFAEDDAGDTSRRVALYWPGDGAMQDVGAPFAVLPTLESEAGVPLDFQPPSDEMLRLSEARPTQPLAYSFDSLPLITLVAPDVSSLGSTGLDEADIRLDVEGWTVLSQGSVRPGEGVLLQANQPLASGVGVSEVSLELRFVADGDDGSTWTIATQALPLRVYRVLGPASFGQAGNQYSPWVPGIDPALRAIEGTPGNQAAVTDALVDWIYNDLGLVYDTERGASAYSDYGWSWDTPHFYFTEFLGRSWGEIINCTDAGNILTTYSNMVGAEIHHLIILEDFDLNEIKAIGVPDYTSCPFGPFSCGFSYHAVTTNDGGDTIWDATLALDGDDDPGEGPWFELGVQSISGEEYLDRLVRGGPAGYYYESQGTIQ
jgi:hypothetical protein